MGETKNKSISFSFFSSVRFISILVTRTSRVLLPVSESLQFPQDLVNYSIPWNLKGFYTYTSN